MHSKPIAVAFLTLCAIFGLAAHADTITRDFNIAAQPAATALNEFARQADITLVFSYELVSGANTNPLKGKYSIGEALAKMLEGTTLSYSQISDNTVAISDKAASKTSAEINPGNIRLAQSENTDSSEKKENSELSSDSSENKGIQEVVVTAQKREERLQDVPTTVTAISGEEIKRSGAVDLKDILGNVPGLSYTGSARRGSSQYTIRGISTAVRTPTTGIYLDDISLVDNASFDTGAFDAILFDLDRVEVLKGPQGTLYGSSAMGGAIKYVSARPDLSEVSSEAAAGLASTAHGSQSYDAQLILNLPLVQEKLAVRGGVYYNHEGGYIDNIAGLNIERASFSSTPHPVYTPLIVPSLSTVNREDFNFADTYVGRLSLLWQPEPSLSIRPAVLYQSTTSANPNYILPGQGLVYTSRYTSQKQPDEALLSSVEVNKSWSRAELTSLTAYFDREATAKRDYSFYISSLIPPLYEFESLLTAPTHTMTFSQELRLSSAAQVDARLRWAAGLYYSRQKQTYRPLINTFDAGAPNDVTFISDNIQSTSERALFGEASYRVTDALDITAGVRLFRFDAGRTFIRNEFVLFGLPPSITDDPSLKLEDGVNPKVGFSYKLNDRHLLFTSAAKGFRPGGAIGALIPQCDQSLRDLGYATTPSRFDADNLWSYEIGSKNEFADGRVILNGAVYYTDWKDIQQSIFLASCGSATTLNAGRARVRGAEFEARFNFGPASWIGLNGSYTEAKIVDASTGSTAQDGDEVLATPRWIASGYLNHSIPLRATWELQLRGDYQYRSKQRRMFDAPFGIAYSDGTFGTINFGEDVLFQNGFRVISASAALSNNATTVRLYVNNALDEAPALDANLGVGITQATTFRPRTIGVEVRQSF